MLLIARCNLQLFRFQCTVTMIVSAPKQGLKRERNIETTTLNANIPSLSHCMKSHEEKESNPVNAPRRTSNCFVLSQSTIDSVVGASQSTTGSISSALCTKWTVTLSVSWSDDNVVGSAREMLECPVFTVYDGWTL